MGCCCCRCPSGSIIDEQWQAMQQILQDVLHRLESTYGISSKGVFDGYRLGQTTFIVNNLCRIQPSAPLQQYLTLFHTRSNNNGCSVVVSVFWMLNSHLVSLLHPRALPRIMKGMQTLQCSGNCVMWYLEEIPETRLYKNKRNSSRLRSSYVY
eukprot:scaffold23859_cov147-Cylindrotheca_fusiformis.AAC.1